MSGPHRDDVDGLRGLAVLLVVAYHLQVTRFYGGSIGVDVFFVISGFVITNRLLDDHAATGRIDLWGFAARRMRRLLPAAALVLLVTTVAFAAVHGRTALAALHGEIEAVALAAGNIFYAVHGVAYGARDVSSSPFEHFWSLAVEEQFYLVWPAILLVSLGWRARSPSGARRRALVVVAALGLASFAASVVWSRSNPTAAFYLLPTRGWELLAGCLLALARPTSVGRLRQNVSRSTHRTGAAAKVRPIAGSVGAWCGFGLVLLAAHRFTDPTTTPGVHALVPVAGAALLVAPTGQLRWDVRRLLAARPLRHLGIVSYGIYLWHWPIIVLTGHAHAAPSLLVDLALTAAAVAAAELSFWLVERPIRSGRLLPAAPRPTILAGLGLVVVTFVVGSTLSGATAVAGPPTPSCAAPSQGGNTCSSGPADADRTIVLIGDSHAGQWAPALRAAADPHRWRVSVFAAGGCRWFGHPGDHVSSPACAADLLPRWRRDIRALHPDVIVVSDADHDALAGNPTLPPSSAGPISAAQYRRDVVTAAAAFPSSARIVVLGDTPRPPDDVPTCLAEHRHHPAACDLLRSRTTWASDARVVADAAQAIGATYVDTVAWVCPTERCPVVRHGIVVYRDDQHLSEAYSATLEPQVAGAVSDALVRGPG